MSALPAPFLSQPLAHRGLHDLARGVPENSLASFEAAIKHGYGIELDLQLSRDSEAIVFHDYALDRLTGESGPVAQRTAAELGQIPLKGGVEPIPTLAQTLACVAGRAPLLIELKDQDGALGPNVGALEEATLRALQGYEGLAALMSFNPESTAKLAALGTDLPLGITTCDFAPEDWPLVSAGRLGELRSIPDYTRTGACFISHDVNDLASSHVARLKAKGAAVLCWTVRSPEAEQTARQFAENITFEGYLPA